MSEEKKFTFEDKDYFIKPADGKAGVEAQKVYNRAFKKGIEEGAIMKRSLDDHMRRQGLWDDDKQEEYDRLVKKSADLEYEIKSGKFKKASQLREKALELKELRGEITSLMMVRNSMDSVTADGAADNERFFYLVSVCVYDYLTQRPVYSSLQDYKDQADSPLAVKCATEYAEYAYGLDDNYADSLIENRLLRKLGLLNEDGRLVDKQGRLVDTEGNLVNENGFRVNEEGERIDINNNPLIDDDVIDTLEFEDDLSPEESTPSSTSEKVEAS